MLQFGSLPVVFVGDDVSDTLALVLKFEPEWDALPSNTPLRIRQLIQTCLQKDPKQRVRDIGDARLAMQGVFETTVGSSSEQGGSAPLAVWQRPTPAAIAALALLVVGGAAVWGLIGAAPSSPSLVARFPIPLASDQTFSFTTRPLVAISPDGTHVVYAANSSLWLRPVDQLQAIQVPGTEQAEGPFLSADGQSIGFWANDQLKKVSVSGGAPVTLADVPTSPFGASWGADDMILFGQPEGVLQVPGASGTPELLIPLEDADLVHGPQMLPGGEWVLLTVRRLGQSWDEAQIVAQSVTTGARAVLIDGGRDGRYLPTGHLVYNSNNVLFAVPFDVGSRQVTGGPVPLVEEVRPADGLTSGAAQFSVSASGSLVYVPDSEEGEHVVTFTWVDRNGDEEDIPVPPRVYRQPRVSPDGTRVAVTIVDGDNLDVWIWDLARETLTQLTFDEALDAVPLWTPDSARVVFASTRDGGGVFWKAADGTGQVERLAEDLGEPDAWTADGRLIVRLTAGGIAVLTMEGERTVEGLLLDDVLPAPALSPDGRWLAYTASETGRPPLIYVRPFPNIDDGPWRVSPDFGVDPVWSPDGRELFYQNRTDLMVAEIETEPTFRARTPERLLDVSNYRTVGVTGRQYDLAPDGDRFIFLTPEKVVQTSDEEPFNGLIFVEHWFEELTARVPTP